MKRITAILLSLLLMLPTCLTAAAATTSATQITGNGGSGSADNVTFSKSIAGTSIENVFDITLKVTTKTNVQTITQDPDMAVVIVMDISNSMKTEMDGVTKRANTYDGTKNANQYEAALVAAGKFVDQYRTATANSSTSKIGLVAFNSNAYQMAAMQEVKTTAQATAFKTTYTEAMDKKIYHANYGMNTTSTGKTRFTNIQAGLLRGYNMIKSLPNQNKFIVFLSDGFPTTYINASAGTYTGYDTYTPGATSYTEGVFYDAKQKHPCSYGTSYSDRAAVKARQQAVTIKNAGVEIFSIGVNVEGQTIKNYDTHAGDNFSVIDRSNITDNSKYEVGGYSSATSFKNWLKGSATAGIGSGYYYDSTNQSGLNTAFTSIFNELKTKTQTNSAKAWQVSDPMGTNLEFIGFYNSSGILQSTSTNLTGSWGAAKENTVAYTSSSRTFNWNLQKSGYSLSSGTYTYTLKYRVRLTNEAASGFAEGTSYKTNGTTRLTYNVITTSNGNSTISGLKTLDAGIPQVKGYLGEISFTKKDQFGKPVQGAVFTLVHDTAQCKTCKGSNPNTYVAANGNLGTKTATSNASGVVSFTKIPSGHIYKLTETTAPTNYAKDPTAYKVTVAYDAVTHNLPSGSVVTNKKLTARVMLKKIDGTNQRDTLLPGAEFRLYTNTALTAEAKHPDGTAVGKITTDANGIADLGVLDVNATYYLKEVKPPEGYVPMDGYVTIKVADSTGAVTYIQEGNSRTNVAVTDSADPYTIPRTYTLTITNNPGIELPSTGGPGTAAFYIIGSVLLTGAGLILVARRRMSVL